MHHSKLGGRLSTAILPVRPRPCQQRPCHIRLSLQTLALLRFILRSERERRYSDPCLQINRASAPFRPLDKTSLRTRTACTHERWAKQVVPSAAAYVYQQGSIPLPQVSSIASRHWLPENSYIRNIPSKNTKSYERGLQTLLETPHSNPCPGLQCPRRDSPLPQAHLPARAGAEDVLMA